MPDPYRLDSYADEVKAGLPNHKDVLDSALENQAFFDLDAARYVPSRSAEANFDYAGRDKRESGLTREAVEVLCDHLYSPGPSRSFDVPAGEEFLERVWADNHLDALMLECDELSTLNDVCAVQCDAGAGDFDRKPVTLRVWGREEFWAWCDPSDCTRVVAVVTIDRFDLVTTYRLWDEAEVRVYRTGKAGGTSAGRVADPIPGESGPHGYGSIPFIFIHYKLPVRRFQTPGLGTFLRKAEVRVNDRLSRLDESIHKHLNPIPVAEGVPPTWTPAIEPQRFIRLPGGGLQPNASGGFETAAAPRLYYLSAAIDVASAWEDCRAFVNQALEAARVPLSAVRMEQSGVASGISLLVEQAPLLTRARKRRATFGVYEQQLATLILTCAGNHYGKPALTAAAASGRLTLGWPEPSIPVPGPDRTELDAADVEAGYKSRIQVLQERHGCDRDQAIGLLKRIAEDRKEEDTIDPAPGRLQQLQQQLQQLQQSNVQEPPPDDIGEN